MYSQKCHWIFVVVVIVTLVFACHGFKQRISKKTVDGKRIRFCEYKLMKMLPNSTFWDAEACLKCSCSGKALTCNDIKNVPGCKPMAGGLMTQNPFEKKWKRMVDGLTQKNITRNYRILQVRTGVVAGTMIYMWLLVDDRLCDLTVFKNLRGRTEITADSCDLKAVSRKNPMH